MEFHGTKHAIELYNLENIYLQFYFSQKGAETTEISCFDGNYCIREAINAIIGLWHRQFSPKWYTYLWIPDHIYVLHNARYSFVWNMIWPSQLGRQRPQKRKAPALVRVLGTSTHGRGVTKVGTLWKWIFRELWWFFRNFLATLPRQALQACSLPACLCLLISPNWETCDHCHFLYRQASLAHASHGGRMFRLIGVQSLLVFRSWEECFACLLFP